MTTQWRITLVADASSEWSDVTGNLHMFRSIEEWLKEYGMRVVLIETSIEGKAKAAIRKAAQVLDVSPVEADKVCRMVDDGQTIDEALAKNANLAELYRKSEAHKRWINTARDQEHPT